MSETSFSIDVFGALEPENLAYDLRIFRIFSANLLCPSTVLISLSQNSSMYKLACLAANFLSVFITAGHLYQENWEDYVKKIGRIL